jgi:GDSL/SGNH-like Acyl-Esterase family found in Pmr5 and Cas1p
MNTVLFPHKSAEPALKMMLLSGESKSKQKTRNGNGVSASAARIVTMSMVVCCIILSFSQFTGESSLMSRFMLKSDPLEYRFDVQASKFINETDSDSSSDHNRAASTTAQSAYSDEIGLVEAPASALAAAPTRLCTSEELRFGEFRKTILTRPLYFPSKSKCYSPEYLLSAKEWTDYRWHPFPSKSYYSGEPAPGGVPPLRVVDMENRCDFTPDFTSDSYCRLANNKTIGFLGDSLTWEHFASLAGRLGRVVGAHDQLGFIGDDGKRYDQNKGIILDVCNGTSKIAFMRNRYAMYVDGFLNMTMADVVVVNTGAHGRPDKHLINGFLPEKPNTGVKWIIKVLAEHQERKRREEGRNVLSIWRTTSPGHHSCVNFTKPVNNYTFMEDHILNKANYPNEYEMNRNKWFDYQRQNQLVIQAFEEYNQGSQDSENTNATRLNYEILHGYEVMLLRPDGHVSEKDCLHNCDPGAVDVYNVLLLHLLRLHETETGTVSLE